MFWRYNLFGLLWAVFILALTATPGFAMPETIRWNLLEFDKFAHLGVFAVLALLLIIGFKKQYSFVRIRENAVLFALGITTFYGVSIEFLQSIIPGRSIEFADVIADISGALVGWGLYGLIYKW